MAPTFGPSDRCGVCVCVCGSGAAEGEGTNQGARESKSQVVYPVVRLSHWHRREGAGRGERAGSGKREWGGRAVSVAVL